MNVKSYPYRQKIWLGPLVMAFFGSCAVFYWQKAQGNQRGLIINHLIELSPQNATNFYWAFFAASLIFSLLGLLAFFLSFRGGRYVTLSPTGLSVPNGLIRVSHVEISYGAVLSLRIQKVQKQRFLQIVHTKGKFSLAQSMLPSREAFDEIRSVLAARATIPPES